jgi:hypothetical protein
MYMSRNLVIFFAILFFIIAALIYSYQKTEPSTVSRPPQETNIPTTSPKPQAQNPSHPLIVLDQPIDGQKISSPLKISGKARGNWFFEASFPILLTNWDGLIIAEGFATAQGDWMTEEFVPFTSELTFTADKTVSDRGTLILQKSNASGLPENDDAYEITVFFE